MKLPSVADRLGKNRFVLDEAESHIEINQDLARMTGAGDALVACCPAHVYSKAEDGTILIEYAACLECGTCTTIVDESVLSWHYPRGGFGVQFREG